MKVPKLLVAGILLVLGTVVEGYGRPQTSLHHLNAALTKLAAKVSPAVVQIVVSGYGPSSRDSGHSPVLAHQQSIGSGVILDPKGYIITNAHVINGAERIAVVITKAVKDSRSAPPETAEQFILQARVVGTSDYFDLALLKVDADGLPTLPFADFRRITQGELVVAVGSPQGLENSTTLGIVSSVARQADPASPVAYIQTDAPINPGNSGGPLVDVDGNLVGINTFILTQSGGSEGLGFALPSPVVNMVYQSLRTKGHVDRRTMGMGAQQITPVMALALGLPRAYGLIVCDVLPGGPAEQAGMKIGDVIIEANDRSISTPPQLDGMMYSNDLRQPMSVTVLRDNKPVQLHIMLTEQPQHADGSIEPSDPQSSIVRQLGIMAATLTPDLASKMPDLRIPSGVIVVARTADPTEADLESGDIIHAVNNVSVEDVEALRHRFKGLGHGSPIVLQVERQGGLQFVTFEVE